MTQFIIDRIALEIQRDRMREAARERLLREAVGSASKHGSRLGPALISIGRRLEALGMRLGAEPRDPAVAGGAR